MLKQIIFHMSVNQITYMIIFDVSITQLGYSFSDINETTAVFPDSGKVKKSISVKLNVIVINKL